LLTRLSVRGRWAAARAGEIDDRIVTVDVRFIRASTDWWVLCDLSAGRDRRVDKALELLKA
jgi:hypothetical protein